MSKAGTRLLLALLIADNGAHKQTVVLERGLLVGELSWIEPVPIGHASLDDVLCELRRRKLAFLDIEVMLSGQLEPLADDLGRTRHQTG